MSMLDDASDETKDAVKRARLEAEHAGTPDQEETPEGRPAREGDDPEGDDEERERREGRGDADRSGEHDIGGEPVSNLE